MWPMWLFYWSKYGHHIIYQTKIVSKSEEKIENNNQNHYNTCLEKLSEKLHCNPVQGQKRVFPVKFSTQGKTCFH